MAGWGGRGKSGSATASKTGGVVAPDGVVLTQDSDGRTYDFQEGNSRVRMTIGFAPGRGDAAIVAFSVNGSYSRATRDRREGIRIARRVDRIMRADVASRPDGFRYTTSASTADGLGASRARLYTRAGFSSPVRLGGSQYGIVRNGRLTPSSPTLGLSPNSGTRALFDSLNARRQSMGLTPIVAPASLGN